MCAVGKRKFLQLCASYRGEGLRIRPSGEMWKKSEIVFQEVIERLEPHIIVVLGKEVVDNLPTIPEGIQVCFLIHPPYGSYGHAVNDMLVQNAIEMVKSDDDLMLVNSIKENKWNKSSSVAKFRAIYFG
ncbi:hypothetical protein ITG09_10190 [Vibrio cyclitrophicus]|nr:hypothetical protein [Vibrio cyclitrophicus]UPR51080.1 hypothetical protein ITG09_10190 [Vibrio cyclitrophicus]